MSEISAWHHATSDMDEAVTRPDAGEATSDIVSIIELDSAPAATEESGEGAPGQTVAFAASATVDASEGSPSEPLLLLADHSGESSPAEAGESSEHDELEHGIASVIASLYSDSRDDSGEAAEADESDEAIEVDDAVTYRLLGELDRLWHRAA